MESLKNYNFAIFALAICLGCIFGHVRKYHNQIEVSPGDLQFSQTTSVVFENSLDPELTYCSNMCTDVLKRHRTEEIVLKVPCLETYTARCGWLSLTYCNFTRQTYCDKRFNDTITSYYITTDCCRGFFKAQNGTCIKQPPGVKYVRYNEIKPTPHPNDTATEDPNYVEVPHQKPVEKSKTPELSGGGYAGIACGFVFLVCIVAFTINAIRKKRRAFQKCQNKNPTPKVLYAGPVIDSSEPVDSAATCMPQPNAVQIVMPPQPNCPVSGQTTPHSPQHTAMALQGAQLSEKTGRRTPPDLSDTEAEAGVTPLLSKISDKEDNPVCSDIETGASPLISQGQDTDDIPESDV